MELYGSLASPYVRRVRLLLSDKNYAFHLINVLKTEDRKRLLQLSPTLRVPVLVDGNTVIWDSSLICKYLLKRDYGPEEEKMLVLINELNDSAMYLFQLRKFETDPNDQGMFSKNCLQRIKILLEYFENYKMLQDWNIQSQWLYCSLDWMQFRSIYRWESKFHNLLAFYNQNKNRSEILLTAPK